MKLKVYLIMGYLISTFLTIGGLIWAVNRMLIAQRETYFVIGMTLLAILIGAVVSLFLLSPVFSSLQSLKKQASRIGEKDFTRLEQIKGPTEFQELALAFNKMAANLEETFASLEASEQEKGLMIAQLSHDIKTPITSIQATVEGILDGVITPQEERQYLQTIGRQVERLNKLVEELNVLTLNHSSSNAPLQKKMIFLDQLLIDCMSEFQLLIEQEKRDVAIQVRPASAKIMSNYDILSRIIINVISNAFKYSSEGSQLEILAVQKENQLIISVKDHGQGIRPEDLELIFKRLYRVESSRNMETGGHGLGLAIARELAQQLGGDIKVESQIGVGSTFSLILPI